MVSSMHLLVYLACYIFACVTFVRDYFDTTNPSIANSEIEAPADLKISLSDAAMLPIFTIWGHGANSLINASDVETKYTFAAGLVDASYGAGGVGFGGNMTRYTSVPCKELEKEGPFACVDGAEGHFRPANPLGRADGSAVQEPEIGIKTLSSA